MEYYLGLLDLGNTSGTLRIKKWHRIISKHNGKSSKDATGFAKITAAEFATAEYNAPKYESDQSIYTFVDNSGGATVPNPLKQGYAKKSIPKILK